MFWVAYKLFNDSLARTYLYNFYVSQKWAKENIFSTSNNENHCFIEKGTEIA